MILCPLIPTAFEFPRRLAPTARRVAIVGSFNGWDAAAHPLTKTPDGGWAITVYFPVGRVVYGFDIDGVFRPDPFDEDRMPNGRGSRYSIRYVRPNVDTRQSGVAAEVRASLQRRRRSLATQTRRRRALRTLRR
jgi:1,4-alpha-glucan branching enzyme